MPADRSEADELEPIVGAAHAVAYPCSERELDRRCQLFWHPRECIGAQPPFDNAA